MLNKDGIRELAYVARVEEIRPLDGYDRVEYARIGAGWWLIVPKGQFKVGDLGVYFEPDSRVPQEEPFLFLEKRNYKIKAMKMCKVVSQGLLMHFDDFGWQANKYQEGTFLTKELKVTYADDEDNIRKANTGDKYRSMQDRHKKIFKTKWAKWLMKREWGRKLMFMFFGKKKDKRGWPAWVSKTDEERVQNMGWLFPTCTTKWIATEKIDGTSTTFTMRNDRKKQLLVCSRNVVYDTPAKADRNFYKDTDGNVYLEMAAKYNMETVLRDMIAAFEKSGSTTGEVFKVSPQWGKLQYITIQGETYGGTVQKRDYGLEHRLKVFNIIFGYENNKFRLNPIDGKTVAEAFGLDYVPVVAEDITLPSTCDEVVAMAHGKSEVDGKEREGLVFRSYDGTQSFKAVDPEFLIKYHSN